MQSDEDQIRQLVSKWLEASKARDVGTVLNLTTEDVVFLVAGQPAMRKPDFAAALRAISGTGAPEIDGQSEIQEIVVSGDWAFMWTKLKVVATPPDGPPIERSGHTLTVLRKENGKWLLARDANLLAAVPRPSA